MVAGSGREQTGRNAVGAPHRNQQSTATMPASHRSRRRKERSSKSIEFSRMKVTRGPGRDLRSRCPPGVTSTPKLNKRWLIGSGGDRPRLRTHCRHDKEGAVVFEQFLDRAKLPAHVTLRAVVDAVQSIPYGRPTSRTPVGVVVDWRGTCSTKHALLAQLLGERWPALRPRLVHRVYRAGRADIQRRHGARVAAVVPEGGLMDGCAPLPADQAWRPGGGARRDVPGGRPLGWGVVHAGGVRTG